MALSVVPLLLMLVIAAPNPAPSWHDWQSKGGLLALARTSACLGSDWRKAEKCISVASRECTNAMQASLIGYDRGLGECYEAEEGAWKVLLQRQLAKVTNAVDAREKEDQDRVRSAREPIEIAQRKWEDWVDADAKAVSDTFGSGTLAYSQYDWTRLELTSRRAIELHHLAEMLLQ